MNGYPDLLVLDLEAAPARHGGNGNRLRTRDLNHISRSVLSVASVLQITGKGESVELRTFEGEEIEILQDVDQMLAAKPDHELVTFNGTHFDLPLLRIRSIVHHLFNLDSIGSLWGRTHHDVMKLFPGLRSLAGCSDLLGLDIDVRTMTQRQQCEADVVRTCLVWFHFAALSRRDGKYLLTAWQALSRNLGPAEFPHLASLFEAIDP